MVMLSWWSSLLLLVLLQPPLASLAQQQTYQISDLFPCSLTTAEIALLGPDDALDPCIIFDIWPLEGDGNDGDGAITAENSTRSSLIPLVQVTPSNCGNHRDGAVTAVRGLNADQGGLGVAIGFHEDHYVQFTLTSVIAGNPANLEEAEYERRHDQILRSLLETTGAPYIIGSCSFASEVEKEPANEYQAIILAQVGPPSFYASENSNPYVFGFHIDSDTYPLPNVQSLGFYAQQLQESAGNRTSSRIPVRVIYRNKSEFFYSTCQSAIDKLKEEGFGDLQAFLYDPAQDDDGDGETNEFDVDFLQNLADEACPTHLSNNDDPDFEIVHPAIFLCTLTEQDIILERWLETGCRPQSLWLTAATWGWADANLPKVPYIQGGAQFHSSMDYSDAYFSSGQQLLEHNQAIFGYVGGYDQIVSYAIPVLFAQHLHTAYRVTDDPSPMADFADSYGRERLRRAMMVLNVETIFGPVTFDNNQRNIGRGAAGTQWLPMTTTNNDDTDTDMGILEVETTTTTTTTVNNLEDFRNALVSPFLQAEAATVIPAASAIDCVAGDYANATARVEQGSVLASGCVACPVDTFTLTPSQATQCIPCPTGSTTDGMEGSDQCTTYEDNLLGPGILALGYIASCTTWILALGFLGWMLKNRNDPVVKVSQVEFLALICVGTMISSATVWALSFQAGLEEDTSAATAGCMAAPFLYTMGWVLQYSSLSAKTYRLYQTMLNTKRMKRVAVTALHTIPIVIGCVLIDLIIVTAWTVKSPLMYERTEESRQIDEETGMVTISTVGRCVSSDDNFWLYAGPILGFHVFLVIGTNILLCRVRDVADRYQEQKYVALASALMLEILLIGIPVLVSVNDSAEATFIVLTAIVALDDIAVLCCIFCPKIGFQRKGLQEGVQFGESILRDSHKRASIREYSRRSFIENPSESSPPIFQIPGHSSSASPEQSLDSPTTSGLLTSTTNSEEENWGGGGGGERRDSFLKRIKVKPSFLPSKSESIAEETSEDLLKELNDSLRVTPSEIQPSTSQNNKQGGYMMTPAGIIKTSDFYTLPGSQASSTDSVLQQQEQQHLVYDPQRAMEEHACMMDSTKKLMEEHERMMIATAEIMKEHKQLKDELNQTKLDASVGRETTKTTMTDDDERVGKHPNSEMNTANEDGSVLSTESFEAAS